MAYCKSDGRTLIRCVHTRTLMLLPCSTMTSNGNGITPPTSQREVWATSAAIIVGQLLFVILTGAWTCDVTPQGHILRHEALCM